MNALRKSLNLLRLCTFCKNTIVTHLEDRFTPFQNACANCGRYLIGCATALERETQEQTNVQLLTQFVCDKCALPNERFNCKDDIDVCTCKSGDTACKCCKICKYTVSYENSTPYGSSCSRCDVHLIHMYANRIIDSSHSSLHRRFIDNWNSANTYRGYDVAGSKQ